MLSSWLLLALGVAGANAAEWAVLIAGSSGYDNYRHQADVCHAYRVLTKRGFDREKIITMVYDDAANDTDNPYRGKLFNYPWKTMAEAVDVREGCQIDYKGKDVTPDKFLAVLLCHRAAGGRVLGSTESDHVFVNFVDHGGTGIIAFPDDEDVLHANKLISTLKAMYEKKMYSQLTFYLETCESGSMFQGLLPSDLPVYALTAANADESSWGTYCGDDAKVAGKDVGSCLGDLFSVNWMMDTEKNPKKESLIDQYTRVKKLTDKSHVMQFGQVRKFDEELVSDFEGPGNANLSASNIAYSKPVGSVSSRNVRLDYLYFKYSRSGASQDAELLIQEIRERGAVKDMAASFRRAVPDSGENRPKPSELWTDELLGCHERAVDHFGKRCGWKQGRLALSRTLYDLCRRTNGDVAPVLAAVGDVCGPTSRAAEAIVV